MSTDLVAFEDHTLEEIRRLLTMKEAVASSAFSVLVNAVENESLRAALDNIRESAASEHRELEEIVRDWMRAGGSRDAPDVASRDIVYQWADLHEASGRRLRSAAAYAPNSGLRDRLKRLAVRDERHARALRALL